MPVRRRVGSPKRYTGRHRAADHVDRDGKLTLRVNGRLHHIGIGRTHARTPVLMLTHDLDVRVIHAATGELLRELTIDPSRDYQPTGKDRYAHWRQPQKPENTDPSGVGPSAMS